MCAYSKTKSWQNAACGTNREDCYDLGYLYTYVYVYEDLMLSYGEENEPIKVSHIFECFYLSKLNNM